MAQKRSIEHCGPHSFRKARRSKNKDARLVESRDWSGNSGNPTVAGITQWLECEF